MALFSEHPRTHLSSPPAAHPPPSLPMPPDPRAAKQFLLLAHLYAKTDAASLDYLRHKLLPPRYTALQLGAAAAAGAVLTGGECRRRRPTRCRPRAGTCRRAVPGA